MNFVPYHVELALLDAHHWRWRLFQLDSRWNDLSPFTPPQIETWYVQSILKTAWEMVEVKRSDAPLSSLESGPGRVVVKLPKASRRIWQGLNEMRRIHCGNIGKMLIAEHAFGPAEEKELGRVMTWTGEEELEIDRDVALRIASQLPVRSSWDLMGALLPEGAARHPGSGSLGGQPTFLSADALAWKVTSDVSPYPTDILGYSVELAVAIRGSIERGDFFKLCHAPEGEHERALYQFYGILYDAISRALLGGGRTAVSALGIRLTALGWPAWIQIYVRGETEPEPAEVMEWWFRTQENEGRFHRDVLESLLVSLLVSRTQRQAVLEIEKGARPVDTLLRVVHHLCPLQSAKPPDATGSAAQYGYSSGEGTESPSMSQNDWFSWRSGEPGVAKTVHEINTPSVNVNLMVPPGRWAPVLKVHLHEIMRWIEETSSEEGRHAVQTNAVQRIVAEIDHDKFDRIFEELAQRGPVDHFRVPLINGRVETMYFDGVKALERAMAPNEAAQALRLSEEPGALVCITHEGESQTTDLAEIDRRIERDVTLLKHLHGHPAFVGLPYGNLMTALVDHRTGQHQGCEVKFCLVCKDYKRLLRQRGALECCLTLKAALPKSFEDVKINRHDFEVTADGITVKILWPELDRPLKMYGNRQWSVVAGLIADFRLHRERPDNSCSCKSFIVDVGLEEEGGSLMQSLTMSKSDASCQFHVPPKEHDDTTTWLPKKGAIRRSLGDVYRPLADGRYVDLNTKGPVGELPKFAKTRGHELDLLIICSRLKARMTS